MAATEETTGEISSALEALEENQRQFADFAIQALSERFGLGPSNFKVFQADPLPEAEAGPEDTQADGAEEPYDGKPWEPAKSSVTAHYVIQFAGTKQEIKAQRKSSKDFKKANGSVSVGENNWETRVYKRRSLAEAAEGKKVPTVDIPIDI